MNRLDSDLGDGEVGGDKSEKPLNRILNKYRNSMIGLVGIGGIAIGAMAIDHWKHKTQNTEDRAPQPTFKGARKKQHIPVLIKGLEKPGPKTSH